MPIPGGSGPYQVGEFYVPAQDFTAPKVLAPGTGSLVFTGFAPTVAVPRLLVPGVGALTLAGFAPSITGAGPVVTVVVGGRPKRRVRRAPARREIVYVHDELGPSV